ncbi:MAG: fasciclin domain-containing protein [Gemmatimonadota bacterium]
MNAFRRSIRRGTALPMTAIALLTLGLAACDDDSPTDVATQTLADVVDDPSNDLSTLRAALETAGLKQTLDGEGPFTVFTPSNAAFDAVGGDIVASLLEPANADLLEKILTYHVVAGTEALAADLSDGQTIATLQGEDVTISVSGSDVTVNGNTVVTPDIEASNGVAHVIDGVLIPSVDIVDVAVLNGFPTLVDLVREADLEEVLRGTPSGAAGWTVFAPTEEAFAASGSAPEGDALAELLTYHVVEGVVESGDLSDGQVVTTVEGSTFTVNIDGSNVTITEGSGNTVNVVSVDVPAANGVIHVIDEVMLPS